MIPSVLVFLLASSSSWAQDQQGVDLRVDPLSIPPSIRITEEVFLPSDCALVEQCIGGPGRRKLLRFDGSFYNNGSSPLVVGPPEGNPLFEFSACHGHYHLQNAMSYELLDARTLEPVRVGETAVVGRKQGFCIEDSHPVSSSAPSEAVFDCRNQGLSPGWADVYDSRLDCQWIDITDVPSGQYTLLVTVNPDGILPEANLGNNSAIVPMTIQF